METNFSATQLKDKNNKESEKIVMPLAQLTICWVMSWMVQEVEYI
jgi:hypothetical protein